ASTNKTDDVVKVLLIDADRQVSLLVGYLLAEVSHTHYQLVSATDPNHGLGMIAAGECDLVLLNYYWAGQSIGEAFLQKVKTKNARVPIIVLTDELKPTVDQQAIRLGAADYLTANDLNLHHLDRAIRYAIERKSIVDHLNHLAYYDFLTDLPNRVLFQDRLRQAIHFAEREKTQFTLMLVDLDHFKGINDSYGHDTGDKLLKEFAVRLRHAVRRSDTVARVGGDEFMVILNNMGPTGQVKILTEKIIGEVDSSIEINGCSLVIHCSIGIAVYPEAGVDEEGLQHHADWAMYRAKEKSCSSYAFYSKNMHQQKQGYESARQAFIHALASNQIGLYFNPRIHCTDDKIVGVEVNPYWLHPEKGLLEYEQFVWNGLDDDMAGRFTEWLLATSFEYFKRLNISKEAKLVFNIEFRGLFSPKFPQMVEKQLQTYDLSGKQLEFDLSQIAFEENNTAVNNCFEKLQSLGVSFGLNHFGSDKLSLLLLKRLPITILKLDKEFVHEIKNISDDTLLVKALVDFTHGLGKQIVIEGLHSQLPIDDIKALGFDLYKSVFSVDALSLLKLQSVIDRPGLQYHHHSSLKD
nr:diguanylate cyclase [Cellvibrionaceae bacterium]